MDTSVDATARGFFIYEGSGPLSIEEDQAFQDYRAMREKTGKPVQWVAIQTIRDPARERKTCAQLVTMWGTTWFGERKIRLGKMNGDFSRIFKELFCETSRYPSTCNVDDTYIMVRTYDLNPDTWAEMFHDLNAILQVELTDRVWKDERKRKVYEKNLASMEGASSVYQMLERNLNAAVADLGHMYIGRGHAELRAGPIPAEQGGQPE